MIFYNRRNIIKNRKFRKQLFRLTNRVLRFKFLRELFGSNNNRREIGKKYSIGSNLIDKRSIIRTEGNDLTDYDSL